MAGSTFRVVVWSTGGIGTIAVRAVAAILGLDPPSGRAAAS